METPQQPVSPDRPFPAVPVGAPGPGAPVVPRNRRLRLVLVMVTGFLALLCVGGVGIFVSLYDDATEIKRSEPDAVVDSFLRAYLVDRDDTQVALYACTSTPDFTAIGELREEALKREAEFNVRVAVTWSSLAVSGSEDRKDVEAGLVIAGVADGQVRSRRTEQWKFDVVDQDGWRVCGAAKVS